MNKVILTQELECDEENKGVNRDKCVIFSKHRILHTIPNLIV